MKKNIIISIIISCVLFLVGIPEANSGVVVKVRAINPLDKPAEVTIHYPLPEGLTPADVTGKRVIRGKADVLPGSFEINKDKESGGYFVDDQMTLEAKEIVVLEVEAKDVWVVSPDKVNQLYKQTEDLLQANAPQEGEEPNTVAMNLKEEIFKQLRQVLTAQEENTITLVGVQTHIEAYKKNKDMLRQVETDVAMLKNMLVITEEPPQKGEGSPEVASPGAQAAPPGPEKKQTFWEKMKGLFGGK